MKSDTRILIPGAGAVDLLLAAILPTVCTVHAVCREASAKAIGKRGFSLTCIRGDAPYRFIATVFGAPGSYSDYVLITSRSKDTDAICRLVAPFSRDTETGHLQNGIGNEEIDLIRFRESLFERGCTS
jgi:2-dehydropantoate 2-reductase